MSNSLHPFIGFGSDTDCDGTGYYACGAYAADLDGAREALREEFGGMTFDGIYEILPYEEAVQRDAQVRGIMESTYSNPGEEPQPFRYVTLGATWNPWAGPDGDDTIGIPALDTRYED